MAGTDWTRIQDWLLQKYEAEAQIVIKGSITTLEKYRESVGYMRALRDVIDEMNKIAGTDKDPFVER